MKRKDFKKFNKLRYAAAVMFMVSNIPLVAFAASSTLSEYADNSIHVENGSVKFDDAGLAQYFSTDPNGRDSSITVDGVTLFYNSSDADTIDSRITQFKASDKATEAVREITTDLGVAADTGSATTILKPAVPYLNIALGILIVVAQIMLIALTAVDCVYMTSPSVQLNADSQLASGTNGVHVKTGKDGQPKFRFISDEAVFVTANCALGSGKNKYLEYLKLRALAYICVEIMFMVLVTGNIDIISNLVIGLIAGVFKILASLKR